MRVCHWCDEPLIMVAGRGWVHLGGSMDAVRCVNCRQPVSRERTPETCPNCGAQRGWEDDHSVLPVTY